MNIRVRNVNGYGHDVAIACEHGDTVQLEIGWHIWCRECGALGRIEPTTISGPPYELSWSVPKRDWGGL